MGVNTRMLNNSMKGVDFRSILNTNFENIKSAIDNLEGSNVSDTIYTDTFISSVDYVEGTVQVLAHTKGIEVYKLYDGEWVEMCKYNVDGSGMLSITGDSAGVGYSTKEETQGHNEFENLPVGYKSDGTLVIAGTVEIQGADPIEAVGWFKGGLILTAGRIEIPEDKAVISGQAVYVDDKNTGWTVEKPVETKSLVQVIGRISDDCKYIDINIMAWCIAV